MRKKSFYKQHEKLVGNKTDTKIHDLKGSASKYDRVACKKSMLLPKQVEIPDKSTKNTFATEAINNEDA